MNSANPLPAANSTPSIFDQNGLAEMKRAARTNDPKALKAAAQQFEALFMQMVLKSMREATPHEGPFDSDQTRMYESLLDQQMTQVMSSGRGTGLAAMIERQLSRANGDPEPIAGPIPLNPPGKRYPLDSAAPFALPVEPPPTSSPAMGQPQSLQRPVGADDTAAREFVARLMPDAVAVSRETGIPAHYMVAHAALETGWGRSEPRQSNGDPSFNLFGIKAGKSWPGKVVEAPTTEYINGQMQKVTERFRAYGSYSEAFRDYANLLTNSPRYGGLTGSRDAASFARGLQAGGYATDPQYASKLERIISGPTLRNALL